MDHLVDEEIDFEHGSEMLAEPEEEQPHEEDVHENSLAISVADDSGISSLTSYINKARAYPILSREEETVVAVKALAGDKAAKDKLINSNLLLVVKIAHEYKNAYQNLLDLVQEGNVGLVNAVSKFDPERGVRFTTYAGWWIKASILKYIFENSHMIKSGTTKERKKLFWHLRKEQERLAKAGIEVTTSTLAENFNVSEQEIVEMDNLLKGNVSIDASISCDDEGQSRKLIDCIAESDLRPDSMMENTDFQNMLHEKLEAFGGKLKSERERVIFYGRLIADEPLTLQEIGDKFNITKEWVRQIETKILNKLKIFLRELALQTVE